ncbi:LuxR family maltose regulon positive regulatory protein [Agromyces sp. 3263]|uniref:LuxR C-terminal-related transcriptional regulator n=1 Tax=Agromyces sp. 3263 TaxID=2817750 RepID=UPI002865F3AF|nr:LuxR C-terminal-related transcriptional regulator [Agromyces sp. 3263]MDR6906596.1 LuxR family maltose regulon positive regulatory protein [Agromyces sp. 3263]
MIEEARASGARVIGITAPAGYGKSTVLAEWAALEDRAVAWATVDRFDDDAAALLWLLASACSTISPSAARIVPEMRGVGASVLGRSAPLLAATLRRTATPFVLFVDDLHLADSLACRDALEIVLAGVPEGSQVVLASRHQQPHLARLRAIGAAHEIGVEDLRLGIDGARTIFDQAGVDVESDGLTAVVDRCEGWPTGIFLCALLSRAGGETLPLTGGVAFITDYLYRECVGQLSHEAQRFLRRTSVLEQLSGDVCDAVLEAGDSTARLRELESLNLFLIPLDRRRGWYRYHALFREFLLAELLAADPTEATDLNLRAATWFEANGFPAQAVEHLLAAGERDRSARLVAHLAMPTYHSGQVAVLDRWIAELGEPAVEGYPPLAILAAWKAALTGEAAEAERWVSALDRSELPSVSAEQRRAFDSVRRLLRAAMCADGPERALEDAGFALEHEPAWSPWRGPALYTYGSLCLLVGDAGSARRALTGAAATAMTTGNTAAAVFSQAELALLDVEDGAWRAAEEHVRVALGTVDANHMEGYGTTALALAVASRVSIQSGDVTKAERYLARAMRARVQCTYVLPFVSLKVRLQLAKAFVELGDPSSAIHLMREIRELIHRRPRLGLLREEAAVLQRRIERMSGWGGAIPLTPAELRLLPYLQTHLTIREIGTRLSISRNTVSSQLGSIYRKLDVTSRSDAVERAIAVGLLGE